MGGLEGLEGLEGLVDNRVRLPIVAPSREGRAPSRPQSALKQHRQVEEWGGGGVRVFNAEKQSGREAEIDCLIV